MRLIDLPITPLRILGFWFLLVCVAAMLCVQLTLGKPKNRPYIAASGAIALLSFWCGYSVEIYSIWANQLAEYDSPVPPSATWTLHRPLWLFLALALVLFAGDILLFRLLARHASRTLSARSICDGLDQLPDGICVSLPDGFPRLTNNRMQIISHAAFGKSVTDTVRMDRQLEENDLKPGCVVDRQDPLTFIVLQDKTAWRLTRQPIVLGKKPMREAIAYDSTTRYRALCELRERNARMENANRELRESLQQSNRMIREREILHARIRLHDELGNALLTIRNYIENPGEDRENVIDVITMVTTMLQKREIPDRNGDPLYAVEEAARMIGAGIRYEGTLPDKHRDVLTLAIRECLTNAVKHAGGRQVFVRVTEENGQITVALTNDGDPPAKEIKPSGGLLNLLTLCETKGITMTIESTPAFRLLLQYDF